ncbi:hypothetical protein ACJX0J_015150 [Zea mays]
MLVTPSILKQLPYSENVLVLNILELLIMSNLQINCVHGMPMYIAMKASVATDESMQSNIKGPLNANIENSLDGTQTLKTELRTNFQEIDAHAMGKGTAEHSGVALPWYALHTAIQVSNTKKLYIMIYCHHVIVMDNELSLIVDIFLLKISTYMHFVIASQVWLMTAIFLPCLSIHFTIKIYYGYTKVNRMTRSTEEAHVVWLVSIMTAIFCLSIHFTIKIYYGYTKVVLPWYALHIAIQVSNTKKLMNGELA